MLIKNPEIPLETRGGNELDEPSALSVRARRTMEQRRRKKQRYQKEYRKITITAEERRSLARDSARYMKVWNNEHPDYHIKKRAASRELYNARQRAWRRHNRAKSQRWQRLYMRGYRRGIRRRKK